MCDLMKKLEQKQNSVTVEQLSLKPALILKGKKIG